jgi:hypothetical protein
MAGDITGRRNIFGAAGQSPTSFSPALRPEDEISLRKLAVEFFTRWAYLDLDGYLSLWSARAPERGTRKIVTGGLFAGSKRIELSNLATRKINMAEDRAVVRVIVEAKVIASKTSKAEDSCGRRPAAG